MNADQPKARSLDAIKGSLAQLSPRVRSQVAEVSPAADRLLDDLAGLVELAESYRDRFGPLALANVQRNPAPISKALEEARRVAQVDLDNRFPGEGRRVVIEGDRLVVRAHVPVVHGWPVGELDAD